MPVEGSEALRDGGRSGDAAERRVDGLPGAYGPTGARMTICGGAGTLEGVVVKLEPLLALYATFTPSVASTNTSGSSPSPPARLKASGHRFPP